MYGKRHSGTLFANCPQNFLRYVFIGTRKTLLTLQAASDTKRQRVTTESHREVLTCSMEVMVSPLFQSVGAIVVVLGLNPTEDVARERVDLMEVNHFYDEQGRLVFDQVIFYDWSPEHSRYMVRAWRLVKNPTQLPERDWREGGYLAVWQDGEVVRRVQAPSMRESWTQYDPELAEREYLPKERRKELRKELRGAKGESVAVRQ